MNKLSLAAAVLLSAPSARAMVAHAPFQIDVAGLAGTARGRYSRDAAQAVAQQRADAEAEARARYQAAASAAIPAISQSAAFVAWYTETQLALARAPKEELAALVETQIAKLQAIDFGADIKDKADAYGEAALALVKITGIVGGKTPADLQEIYAYIKGRFAAQLAEITDPEQRMRFVSMQLPIIVMGIAAAR